MAGLFSLGMGLVVAQDYPHAFPRDGVEKLLENERVIVWEVFWPNGGPQPYHRHRYDMTGVFLEWGPLCVTRLDGTFTESQDPFEIPWVFFLNKGVTHKEEGIGPPTRHSIMIDMKEHDGSTPAPRTDISPAFPREGAEEELDSPRVMVWDVSWSEGQEVPIHVHPRDTVAVFLEGGTFRVRGEGGSENDRTFEYKEVVFIPAGTTHGSATLMTGGSARAMLYELKD